MHLSVGVLEVKVRPGTGTQHPNIPLKGTALISDIAKQETKTNPTGNHACTPSVKSPELEANNKANAANAGTEAVKFSCL